MNISTKNINDCVVRDIVYETTLVFVIFMDEN